MRVRTMKRSSVLIAIVLTVSLLAMLSPATAAPGYAAAGPGGASAGYLTPTAVLQKGNNLKFLNLDIALHDLDHLNKPGNPQLFSSPTIGIGKQVVVTGTRLLRKGSYPFYCSIHPNMKGQLRVI